jgi:hypothetical protein
MLPDILSTTCICQGGYDRIGDRYQDDGEETWCILEGRGVDWGNAAGTSLAMPHARLLSLNGRNGGAEVTKISTETAGVTEHE